MGIHPREPKRTTFCVRHFCERLQTACTKAITAELMNVNGEGNVEWFKSRLVAKGYSQNGDLTLRRYSRLLYVFCQFELHWLLLYRI